MPQDDHSFSLSQVCFLGACRKQPQDCVPPLARLLLITLVVWPQSHLHSQISEPHRISPVGFTATSRPNRCPVRSTRIFPAFMQPQEGILFPFRAPVVITVIFPQSHLHSQTTCPFLRASVAARTISFPNLWPDKSLQFLCNTAHTFRTPRFLHNLLLFSYFTLYAKKR